MDTSRTGYSRAACFQRAYRTRAEIRSCIRLRATVNVSKFAENGPRICPFRIAFRPFRSKTLRVVRAGASINWTQDLRFNGRMGY